MTITSSPQPCHHYHIITATLSLPVHPQHAISAASPPLPRPSSQPTSSPLRHQHHAITKTTSPAPRHHPPRHPRHVINNSPSSPPHHHRHGFTATVITAAPSLPRHQQHVTTATLYTKPQNSLRCTTPHITFVAKSHRRRRVLLHGTRGMGRVVRSRPGLPVVHMDHGRQHGILLPLPSPQGSIFPSCVIISSYFHFFISIFLSYFHPLSPPSFHVSIRYHHLFIIPSVVTPIFPMFPSVVPSPTHISIRYNHHQFA